MVLFPILSFCCCECFLRRPKRKKNIDRRSRVISANACHAMLPIQNAIVEVLAMDSDDYLFALSTAAWLRPVIWSPCGGAGVLDRVGGAERLCAMCALTRWPAASAEHSDSSPASTVAAMTRASNRAFSPGVTGWAPRTPSMSSMAD